MNSMNIPASNMWHKMRQISQMNEELMQAIQKKKRLRYKLQEMNQRREEQQMHELTEWACFQTKLLLSDIDSYEQKQFNTNQHVVLPQNTETQSCFHKHKDTTQIQLNDDHHNEAEDDQTPPSEAIANNPNDDHEDTNKLTLQSLSNLATATAQSNAIIAELFGKKSDNHSDTSSVSSSRSDNGGDGDIQEAQNKKLEALRKRIERMKSQQSNKSKSLKSIALSVVFIESLKRMVARNRPKKAAEFNRTLSQILKPYTTLTCNLLKLYSAPVFRSIMRNKITLIGYSKTKDIFTSIFKLKSNIKSHVDDDGLLFIQVHVLKLIQCLSKYIQNAPDVLMEFLNGYLLNDKPALFEYVYGSELRLLQWDKYNFIVNYTASQKKMILLNFIAVRCMLQEVIFGHVKGNKFESHQKMNLFCIASVYYYLIRSYNAKLLDTDGLIAKDIEIGVYHEKLLNDDHSIYDKLGDLIQDGMNTIDTLLDDMMDKMEAFIEHGTDT
eukprot:121495_1